MKKKAGSLSCPTFLKYVREGQTLRACLLRLRAEQCHATFFLSEGRGEKLDLKSLPGMYSSLVFPISLFASPLYVVLESSAVAQTATAGDCLDGGRRKMSTTKVAMQNMKAE